MNAIAFTTSRLLAILGALSLGACLTPGGQPSPLPPGSTHSCRGVPPWGKYAGPIRTEWLPGRKMKLLADVHFVDGNGKNWLAPKDAEIDGASIPKPFWSVIGGPFDDLYRDASVFHDVACDQRREPWEEVHCMFYQAMRASGVPEQKAKTMYAAVYRFGPHWEKPSSGRSPASGAPVAGAPVKMMAPERPPTAADAAAIQAWVQASDPSLEAIRTTRAIPGQPTP